MTKLRDFTMNRVGLVVFVLFITAALVDLGFLVFGGTAGTISTFLVNTSFASPLISIVFGLLAGHLFFGMWPSDWDERTVRKRFWDRVRTAVCSVGVYEGVRQIVMALR